jgi:hypothetical protein
MASSQDHLSFGNQKRFLARSCVRECGEQIWIADAHRDDGKRFVVRADEKTTAFVEIESAIRSFYNLDI